MSNGGAFVPKSTNEEPQTDFRVTADLTDYLRLASPAFVAAVFDNVTTHILLRDCESDELVRAAYVHQ